MTWALAEPPLGVCSACPGTPAVLPLRVMHLLPSLVDRQCALGLSPSSSASALLVGRHSVPWACLPHPWVAFPWLDKT